MDISVHPTRRRTGKKSKKPDGRPARKRYWAARKLEGRKVGNLVRSCGMTKQSAYNRWHRDRKGRVPDGYLNRYVGAA